MQPYEKLIQRTKQLKPLAIEDIPLVKPDTSRLTRLKDLLSETSYADGGVVKMANGGDMEVPTEENIRRSQELIRKPVDRPLRERLIGGAEALGTLGTSAAMSFPGMIYALGTSRGKTRQQMEDEYRKFMERNVYQPRTEAGREYAEELGQTLEPLGTLPPVTGIGPGAVLAQPAMRQSLGGLEAAGRAAERVAEQQVPKIMERGGFPAEMLRSMSEGTQSFAAAPKKSKKKKEDDHPLVFPRAEPKSKEEIRPIAQRIAEQMTNQFVRQDPKKTTNVAGKSKKQWEREQIIPLETRELAPPREVPAIDYEKYKDYAVVGVPGDPSLGGVLTGGSLERSAQPTVELTRVGNITPDYPVPLFGGPRFGDDERFWASNYSAAQPIQTNVTELAELYGSPVLGKYIKMAPDSANFALHNLDSLLSIQRPERLSKDKLEKLNDLIRNGSPKYGKFPGFAGFEDPADVLLQSQLNSKLRKHIAETLTKPKVTDALGLPKGLDVVAAITHPELRNLETGISGFSVGEMVPGAKLQKGRSEHPTYDTDIPGALIGRSKYPVPYEIAFPDTTAYARSQLKPGVQEFNMMKLLGPRERIDQQYIDEMKMFEEFMKQYTGKKKGGAVKSGLSSLKKA